MRVNKLRRASDNEQGRLNLSKRAIAKENLMSLIPRGCPKNTDYEANPSLRKQAQE